MIKSIDDKKITPKMGAADLWDIFAVGNLDNITDDDINRELGGDLTEKEIEKVKVQIAKYKDRILRILGH